MVIIEGSGGVTPFRISNAGEALSVGLVHAIVVGKLCVTDQGSVSG